MLSTIFKSMVTHHHIKRSADGQQLLVNNVATGKSTLVDVIEFLRTPYPPAWPMSLSDSLNGQQP